MNLKGIKLTWLGHATFRIETPGGTIIIIDPWVMNNPVCPEKDKTIRHVDVMLCTHAHGDHIGDAVEIGKTHNPAVVAIPELAGWLGKKGLQNLVMMNKGAPLRSPTSRSPWCTPTTPAASRTATRSCTGRSCWLCH